MDLDNIQRKYGLPAPLPVVQNGKFAPRFPLNLEHRGDDVFQFGGKYIGEIENIYDLLYKILTNQEIDASLALPYAIKITEDKLYIRDKTNSEWITIFDITKPNFPKEIELYELIYKAITHQVIGEDTSYPGQFKIEENILYVRDKDNLTWTQIGDVTKEFLGATEATQSILDQVNEILTEVQELKTELNRQIATTNETLTTALKAANEAMTSAQSINIRTFNSVEEMKASNTLKSGALAKTQGFYQSGDGGGADYVITNDIGEDETDEASIIALQNELYAKLLIKDYINIKWFGAKGDGETDDTESIQKALNFGGVFVLSEGEYIITSPLIFSKNTIFAGAEILKNRFDYIYTFGNKGKNIATIVFKNMPSNTTAIQFSTVDTKYSVKIKNITFKADTGYFTTHQGEEGYEAGTKTFDQEYIITTENCNCIDATSIPHVTVEDCNFNGFSGTGLLSGTYQHHYRCDFVNCGLGAHLLGTDSAVEDFYVHHCGEAVIFGNEDKTKPANMSRIINIRIEWIQKYGIYLNSGDDIQLTGIIDRCGYAGIAKNSKNDIWAVYVDMDIRRCGCVYRGVSPSGLTDNDYDKCSNVYLNKTSYFSLRGNNIISSVYDDGSGGKVPLIGVVVNYDVFNSRINPNWVGLWDNINNIRTKINHLHGGTVENELVLTEYSADENKIFEIDRVNNKVISYSELDQKARFEKKYSSIPITLDVSTYVPLNSTVYIDVALTGTGLYLAVTRYVVTRTATSEQNPYFTISTAYKSETNNNILGINTTIDNKTGVLTINKSGTGGGISGYIKVSYPKKYFT